MANGAITYSLGLKTGGFLSGIRAARSGLGSLVRSISTVVAAGAGMAGLTGSFFGLKKAITAAADMESLEVAFRSIINDGAKTDEVLSNLRKLGAETPFEFPELAVAGKQLLAFGENADSVVETLRRVGDVSSGVQAPIGDIAAIYGKARVAGTLFSEDINELTGRGINVIAEFAKQLGVSESQVKKLASEGRITFPMLERAFVNLTSKGGTFYNMMAAQSRTTNGLISTLKDSLNDLFLIIGKPINDFLKPILQGGIDRLKVLGNGLAAFIELLSEAKNQGKLGEFISLSLVVGAKEFVNVLSGGVRGAVAYLGATLPRIMQAANQQFLTSDFTLAIKRIFTGAGNALAGVLLTALAKIPGLSEIETDATRAFNTAKNDFNQVRNIIEDAASPDRLIDVAFAISDAHVAGLKAFKDASAKQLLDTGDDRKKLSTLGKALSPDAWTRFTEALRGKLPKEMESAADRIRSATAGMTSALDGGAAKLRSNAYQRNRVDEGGKPRRGLLNAADSFVERLLRRSKADRGKDMLERSSMERGALNNFFRRQDKKAGRLGGDPAPGADWLYFRLDRGLRMPRDPAGERASSAKETNDKAAAAVARQEKILGSIDQRLAALGLAT